MKKMKEEHIIPVIKFTNYISNQPPHEPIDLIQLIDHFVPFATDFAELTIPIPNKANMPYFNLFMLTINMNLIMCKDYANAYPKNWISYSYCLPGINANCSYYCYQPKPNIPVIVNYQTVKKEHLIPVTNHQYLIAFEKLYNELTTNLSKN